MSGILDDPSNTTEPEPGSDSDDDIKLSATAIAALQEFYTEQGIEQELLNQAYTGKLDSFQPQEDWQLSQFWYDARTADILAREALAVAGDNGCIACVSSPTAYKRIRELRSNTVEVKCFEYDQRFQMYGQDFIFYDFNDPLNLDMSLKNHFDVVVADPPFLSEECLTKTAITVKFLAKDKIILCTGAVMETLAAKLLLALPCQFKPTHQKRLENEFLCYTNYESKDLNSQH
uniref:Protein-lysine N-methyltransferase ORF140848 n=1 Tax=Arion vulgaris TaxID=1028688 RepID=A0A0B7ASV4_9EUPU